MFMYGLLYISNKLYEVNNMNRQVIVEGRHSYDKKVEDIPNFLRVHNSEKTGRLSCVDCGKRTKTMYLDAYKLLSYEDKVICRSCIIQLSKEL